MEKKHTRRGVSVAIVLLILVALAGIAAGVWLVLQKSGSSAGTDRHYEIAMQVGEQKTLEADFDHEFTCMSSDDAVISVDEITNLLTAKKAGEATLVAKDSVSGEKAFFFVTVTENPANPGAVVTDATTTEVTTTTEETTTTTTTAAPGVVSGIALSYYSANVKVGEVHPYALVTMTPEDAANKNEIWETDNDKVATVDKAGRITGVGAGKCKIRVTAEGNPYIFAEIDVTVVDPNAPATTPAPETTTADSASSSTTTVTTTAAGLPQQSEPGGAVTGVSGAPNIEVRNGLTYVNGILIANKTYSLPSTYNPGVDPDAQAAFNEMQAAAAKEGRSLAICSGFRSYSTQQALYQKYVSRDGKAAADRYSARAGHSEHQTGLAFDINKASSSFTSTPEAKWLAENCWKYGFILRYPEGKEDITGYMYESWHVRYLGKELAKSVYDSGLTLEEYLGITSRYAD